MSGVLFVISAASGTGKTSLVKALLEKMPDLTVSVSHTTRPKRPAETHGVHYHFCSTTEFQQKIAQGEFVEHAEVFGNFYGTSQHTVRATLAEGKDVLLEIDWQGALQVKHLFNDAELIFILPPDRDSLKERLIGRGQDSEEVIAQRLAGSLTEMKQYEHFSYLVINDQFEHALEDIVSIVHAARLKLKYQSIKQQDRLAHLLSESYPPS